jgi:hypothetical protein
MHKTDVENILSVEKGILINVSKSSEYEALRGKAIEEQRQKDRINNLEKDVSSIKSLLEQILRKVA